MTKKIILDLDTGVDDALALAYSVATPKAELIGVLASYGNVLTEKSAENSLSLLELLNQTNIPVFLGEKHSSTTDNFEVMEISQKIHGKNGVGNVNLTQAKRQPEKMSAVDFIIDAAHKYKDDLILIPTGPQTNLDAAIKKDPSITKLIKKVCFMGGALTVPGNVTAFTEANISQDPVAADNVCHSGIPLTMVGLDVTLRTLLTKNETKKWRNLNNNVATTYADITDYYIDAYYELNINKNGCALHDPLTVAIALDPSHVQFTALNLKVTHDDKDNPSDIGRTIGDLDNLTKPTNTRVAINLDANYYLNDFMGTLTTLFKKF